MTEMMRGCEGPDTQGETCAACQMSTGGLDPAMSGEPGPNTDQEMQWISAREDSSHQAPCLNTQLFLSPPQGLGADPFRGSPSESCGDLPGETYEEMSRDPPELPCEEMCVRAAPCGVQCPESPCEELCESVFKGPASRRLYEEERYVETWSGKARLPSIVVEPIEGGEVESGELRWPPDFTLLEEAEQDELFADGEEDLGAGLSSFDSDVEEVLL
ncbi:uncharacterized protein LOC114587144 [Podarcis muralis]